jgi:hypothetical protein
MKETTEQFGEVLVNSTEDISLAYPELFTHSKIQSLPFQIESLPFLIEKRFDNIDYSQEPRLVLTHSGIVAITMPEDNEFIWNDYNNEQYRKILGEANKTIKLVNEAEKKGKQPDLTIEKKVGEKTVTIKCFPYNDVEVSANLMKLAEDKMQKYIHSLI